MKVFQKVISMLLAFSVSAGVTTAVSSSFKTSAANSLVADASTNATENIKVNGVTLEDYIVKNLHNFSSEIDVSAYASANGWYTKDYMEKFTKAFTEVITEHPELFFVVNAGTVCQVVFSAKTLNGNVISGSQEFRIKGIKYTMKKSEYPARKAEFDAAVTKAMGVIKTGMSDMEKALALHDYIILNASYDNSYSRYTAYDALVGRVAVCQGYSMAYIYLLQKCGIDSTMITSDAMNHAWNYVKINNKWYHVDVTWDDPLLNDTTDQYGQVKHENFLLSDSKIKETNHYSWNTKGLPPATSAFYDNFFWRKVDTGMFKVGDSWYYAVWDTANSKDGGKTAPTKIKRFDVPANMIYTVTGFDPIWYQNGTNVYFIGNYTRVAEMGGKIYFNNSSTVYCYDPALNKITTFTKPNIGNFSIYGLKSDPDNNRVIYTVKINPYDKDKLYAKSLV